MDKLLVIGCRRSGTTLLASLLGAHSDINMLNEIYNKGVDNLVGKKYQGVKMTIPHIDYRKRTTLLRNIIYPKFLYVVALLKKIGIKLDPIRYSSYSIKDFVNMGSKIVFLYRDKETNIDSMIKRSRISRKRAEWTFNRASSISYKLGSSIHRVSLKELTTNTKETLEGICKYLEIEFEDKMLTSSGLNSTYSNGNIDNKK